MTENIEGKVTAAESAVGETSYLYLGLEGDRIISFPFGGDSLSFLSIKNALIGSRVEYQRRMVGETPVDHWIEYQLKVLDGPLEGKIFEETVFD